MNIIIEVWVGNGAKTDVFEVKCNVCKCLSAVNQGCSYRSIRFASIAYVTPRAPNLSQCYIAFQVLLIGRSLTNFVLAFCLLNLA